MENHIDLDGTLAKDPETNTTPKGSQYTRARMAHSQGYWDTQANRWVDGKTPTGWYTLYASGTAGRQLQSFQKGDKVLVTGSLDMNEWQDKTGANRTEMVIHVKSIARTPSTKQGQAPASNYQSAYQTPAPAVNYQTPTQPMPQSDPWENPEF